MPARVLFGQELLIQQTPNGDAAAGTGQMGCHRSKKRCLEVSGTAFALAVGLACHFRDEVTIVLRDRR